jgi:prophage maintenance system killer protein
MCLECIPAAAALAVQAMANRREALLLVTSFLNRNGISVQRPFGKSSNRAAQ